MHALPSHPRHPLMAGLVVLLLALTGLAATAPDLGTLDFSIGTGSSSAAETYVAPPIGPADGAAPSFENVLTPPVDLLSGRYVAEGGAM